MWIETSEQKHFGNHIKIPELGGPVEFNENGKANVTEQTADIICKEVEHIEKCTKEKDDTSEDENDKEDIED